MGNEIIDKAFKDSCFILIIAFISALVITLNYLLLGFSDGMSTMIICILFIINIDNLIRIEKLKQKIKRKRK